jgi:hypothetical protein
MFYARLSTRSNDDDAGEADFHRGGRERISHAITRKHWFAGLG